MIAVIACVMMVSSCATAVLSGRRAVSVDAVRAVREDW
jgi:putative ABC transport system permease protein